MTPILTCHAFFVNIVDHVRFFLAIFANAMRFTMRTLKKIDIADQTSIRQRMT